MSQVRLGSTGIVVDKNGFGALPIQRISFEEAGKLLVKAYDNGIRYFDTARMYSDSEAKMGEAFEKAGSGFSLVGKKRTNYLNIETDH